MRHVSLFLIFMLMLLAVNAQAQISITARQVPRTVGQQFQYYSEAGDSIPVNIGTTGGPHRSGNRRDLMPFEFRPR